MSQTLPGKPVDIVGIGVSVWDTVFLIDTYPANGSVAKASKHRAGLGGGVAVALATAACVGSSAAMIDCLGDDGDSHQIVSQLQSVGVDVSAIRRKRHSTASVASIWAEQRTNERTIVFSPGTASDHLRWDAKIEGLIQAARILHLNGRHLDISKRAIDIARRNQTLVSFDGGAFRYREETVSLLRDADVAIVARQYAESHCEAIGRDAKTPEDLLAVLRSDLSAKIVGVTCGADGSFVQGVGGPIVYQPAENVDRAVDTTGCGDTFHGAFLHALARNRTIADCSAFAAKVASRNATQLGAFTLESPESPADHHV